MRTISNKSYTCEYACRRLCTRSDCSIELVILYQIISAELNKMVTNVKITKDMWLCFADSILEPAPIKINEKLSKESTPSSYSGYGSKILLNKIYTRAETVVMQ